MRFKSPWSRGLCYGGVCAGILVVIAGAATLIGGARWEEALYACLVSAFTWGSVGFILGFVSQPERSTPAADSSIRSSTTSIIKQWVYRVIAGLMLGYLGAAIVQLMTLALVVVIFGGLDEYLNRRHPLEEFRLHVLGICVMIGSTTAAMVGAFLGVMTAPVRFESRSIIRSSLLASALGALAGAWFGGFVGMLHPQALTSSQAAILALAAGVAAGVVFAVVLRIYGFSHGSKTLASSISSSATSTAKETSIKPQ